MKRSTPFIRAGVTAVLLVLLLVLNGRLPQAQAVSSISVTTTDVLDDPNDGQCDLYEALQASFSQKSSGDPSVTYHECTATSGPKVITFTGAAAGGTITMPAGPGSLSLPFINDDVTLTGPVILDGDGSERILTVAASGTLSLENLTMQNGYTSGGGAAILSNGGAINTFGVSFLGNKVDNDGGAINTTGELNVMATNFAGNEAGRHGGAIYQGSSYKKMQISVTAFNGNTAVKAGGALYMKTDEAEISDTVFNGNLEQDASPDNNTRGGGAIYMSNAELKLVRSIFNGNISLNGDGGAIATTFGCELTIENSSFNGNISGDLSNAHRGGAIYNLEKLDIRGATFLNNLSAMGDGGAIFNDKGAELDAANATFSANGAPFSNGGAVYNGNTQQGSSIASEVTFRNVTLYANAAGNEGSAFYNQDGNHTISLANTIVDDAGGPVDSCNRTLTTLGHNLDSADTCGFNGTGDLTNANADLEPPAFNGGQLGDLFTQLPGENSDAIDAGDNTICSAEPVNNEDQAGGTRPKDGDEDGMATCDIGALEADARIPGYGSEPIQPGPLQVGSTFVNVPVTKTLELFETGNATLTVANPTFGGPDAASFDLVAPFTTFDIANGDPRVDIVIRCTPTDEGTDTATFTLNSNDPVHPVVTYDLTCNGQTGPTPGLGSTPALPGPLDFGQLEVGDSTIRNLTIMETGNDTLTYGNAALSGDHPGDFTFNAFQTSIADGGTPVAIPITCTPSGLGLRTATLSMTTNDPLQPNASWNLVCVGTPPPSPLLDDIGQSINTPANLMDGVYGVDTSPDGRHVYATASLDDQILMFTRDLISGTLTFKAALTSSAINGPLLLAVSPDGAQVYVANGPGSSLVVLERSQSSGLLSTAQTFTSSTIPDLQGAYGVAVSPNGRFIYVTSNIQHAIIGFERLADDTLVYRPANSDSSNVDLIYAQGLTVSPDGRHLYVTAQDANTDTTGNILAYSIDPLTGAITHEQTIHEGDLIGGPFIFIPIDALGGALDVVVSPDGANVYVAATLDDTVVVFQRNGVDGRLTYRGGLRDGQGTVDGLDGARGVDITPDGQYVVATGYNDDAVAIFARNLDNVGRLSQIQVIKRQPAPPNLPLLDGVRDLDVAPDGSSIHAAGFLDDAVVSLPIVNPVPVLYRLFPASAAAGTPAVTVRLTGQEFIPGAVATIGGTSHPTTYINSTTLEVMLDGSEIPTPGTLMFGVTNPTPGGGAAMPELPFVVTGPGENPVPAVEAILPQGIPAGAGADVTLTVQGINFVPASVVRWNGTDRATTYVNGTTLEVTIPTAELSAVGTAVVTVYNPPTVESPAAGGASNASGVTISLPWTNPVPTVLALEPATAIQIGVSGNPLPVTIHGSNFREGAQAQWNGSDRPTQYVSESEVVVTLTAVDTTTGGTGTLTVQNPTPGGGTSNGVPFTIQRYRYGLYLPLTIR